MKLENLLNSQEVTETGQSLRQSRESVNIKSLESLLSRWESTAEKLQKGFDFSIYDLQEDLAARSNLEPLLERLPPAIREKLKTWLEPIDDQYRSATLEAGFSLMAGKADHTAWWCYRIPKRASLEFKKELRGLTSS